MDRNLLETKIIDLNLSIRSFNCLKRAGVETLGDLIEKTPSDIQNMRFIAPKCVTEITNTVHSYGLKLKGE